MQVFLQIVISYIIFSPPQEYIARGCLQNLLTKFIPQKSSFYYPIIISNLIFCSFSISLPLTSLLSLFILGLLWGWLYSRHQTLIGVSISHAMIGICLVSVFYLPLNLF